MSFFGTFHKFRSGAVKVRVAGELQSLSKTAIAAIPPVNATAASGTLTTNGTAPADGATVTIGDQTYTFKTALTASTTANQVLIGVSAAVALDNLKSAVNKSIGGGTTYGSATVANADVTATTNGDTTQLFVAVVGGVAANLVATTETSATLSWGAAVLAGGIDATVATAGDTRVASGFLYVATSDVAVSSTTGWRKVALVPL